MYFCQILFKILSARLQFIMKKSFVPTLFKVSVDHLFDNLESGKRNYCFGKNLENCGSQNLYEPCRTEMQLTVCTANQGSRSISCA